MKKLTALLLTALLLTACGGRVPSPNTAQDIIKDYFNGYGKKYPTSVFGGHKVAKVEILNMEEIQRKLATGQALVTLDDGTPIKIQMSFLHKLPLGWRTQGWENLDASPTVFPQN